MDETTQLTRMLKKRGYSVTKPRLDIFKALQAVDAPLTIAELSDQLDHIDKVSIYRTIDLFEKLNIVHRVWTGFKSKIELSEAFSPHHHHFTCLSCGKTIAIKSAKLEKDLHEFEAKCGFELTHHSVELSGYCKVCKQNQTV